MYGSENDPEEEVKRQPVEPQVYSSDESWEKELRGPAPPPPPKTIVLKGCKQPIHVTNTIIGHKKLFWWEDPDDPNMIMPANSYKNMKYLEKLNQKSQKLLKKLDNPYK